MLIRLIDQPSLGLPALAAKILADNIAALMCLGAQDDLDLPPEHRCNRTHAALIPHRALPRILLAVGDVLALIADAVDLMAHTLRRVFQVDPLDVPLIMSNLMLAMRIVDDGA